MATAPVFTATPITARARVAAANTARDGSGSLVTLYTVPTGGARIERIVWTSAQATAAAQAAMVGRVFLTDAAGANPYLRAEVAIATATPSNTAIGSQYVITFVGGLFLEAGVLVKVCQSIYGSAADQMDVFCEGGVF